MSVFRAAPSLQVSPPCFRDDGRLGARRLSGEGLNCDLNINQFSSHCANISRHFLREDVLPEGTFEIRYMAALIDDCGKKVCFSAVEEMLSNELDYLITLVV